MLSKTKYLLLLFTLLFAFSCDDSSGTAGISESDIIGCWVIVESDSLDLNDENIFKYFKFKDNGLVYVMNHNNSDQPVIKWKLDKSKMEIVLEREVWKILDYGGNKLSITAPFGDGGTVKVVFEKSNECPEEKFVSTMTADFTGLDVEKFDAYNVDLYDYIDDLSDFNIEGTMRIGEKYYNIDLNYSDYSDNNIDLELSSFTLDDANDNYISFNLTSGSIDYKFVDDLVQGTFSFEATDEEGNSIKCSNGKFTVHKDNINYDDYDSIKEDKSAKSNNERKHHTSSFPLFGK